jgi:glucose-6-phosphate 1-dehydrogenase
MNPIAESAQNKLVSSAAPADALVFFGASGDLAYKKIFPSLQAMVRRGRLSVPVIGVAKSGWGLEQFLERAKASITAHGSFDPDAFGRPVGLFHYVDGDYNDPATFAQLKVELRGAQRPTH